MQKIFILLFSLLISMQVMSGPLHLFYGDYGPFKSTEEILIRIRSIQGSAEHCARARSYYYNTGIQLDRGEEACGDYYDWEGNFYSRYNQTDEKYKTEQVENYLGYINELEEQD